MIDAIRLAGTVFSGLSALVIEDVTDGEDVIRVWARTRGGAVACPCGCRKPVPPGQMRALGTVGSVACPVREWQVPASPGVR
jgi:hypothetical protein